jgi:hypothetical protein
VRTFTIPFGRTGAAAAAAVVLAGGLAGCGGGSTASTATVAAASSTGSGAQPSGTRTRGAGVSAAMQAKIQQCLQAAGIAVPTFTGRPSGFPSGARPSGAPSGTRTGGGFGGRYANPQMQAALKACGITIPTRRPGAGGSGGASPMPTASS